MNADRAYNVSFKSLAYFIVAPTLCYQVFILTQKRLPKVMNRCSYIDKLVCLYDASSLQPEYPRSDHIRKGWVLRQVVKLIIFTGVMGFIIEQVWCITICVSDEHTMYIVLKLLGCLF